MKVLQVVRPDAAVHGGDVDLAFRTGDALRSLGVEVDCVATTEPDPRGYDIAHVFGIFRPEFAEPQLRACVRAGVPVALSPIWWDPTECIVRTRCVERALRLPERRIDRALTKVRETSLERLSRRGDRIPAEKRLRLQADMLRMADVLIPNSAMEGGGYFSKLGVYDVPMVVAPIAVSDDAFVAQTDAPRAGIVCAGRIASRKNQAMLLYALRDLDVEITLTGVSLDTRYRALCERFATPRVRFAGHVTRTELLALLARSAVHVLPSWWETAGISSMEAAAAGARVVVGVAGCEFEYFGDDADYLDPGDPSSIRAAVECALARGPRAPGDALELRMRAHNWEAAGRATLAAYRRTLASRPAMV